MLKVPLNTNCPKSWSHQGRKQNIMQCKHQHQHNYVDTLNTYCPKTWFFHGRQLKHQPTASDSINIIQLNVPLNTNCPRTFFSQSRPLNTSQSRNSVNTNSGSGTELRASLNTYCLRIWFPQRRPLKHDAMLHLAIRSCREIHSTEMGYQRIHQQTKGNNSAQQLLFPLVCWFYTSALGLILFQISTYPANKRLETLPREHFDLYQAISGYEGWEPAVSSTVGPDTTDAHQKLWHNTVNFCPHGQVSRRSRGNTGLLRFPDAWWMPTSAPVLEDHGSRS